MFGSFGNVDDIVDFVGCVDSIDWIVDIKFVGVGKFDGVCV